MINLIKINKNQMRMEMAINQVQMGMEINYP